MNRWIRKARRQLEGMVEELDLMKPTLLRLMAFTVFLLGLSRVLEYLLAGYLGPLGWH